jgi:hypothetical protein
MQKSASAASRLSNAKVRLVQPGRVWVIIRRIGLLSFWRTQRVAASQIEVRNVADWLLWNDSRKTGTHNRENNHQYSKLLTLFWQFCHRFCSSWSLSSSKVATVGER